MTKKLDEFSGSATEFKCGFIAVVGRPNVGKSTLINALVGQKVSIVTRKAQTTRHRILGIKTTEHYQLILVDTPGFHLNARQAINKLMNKAALSVLNDVEVIVFMVESGKWQAEEEKLLEKLRQVKIPVVAVVNKTDLIGEMERLLPVIDSLNERYKFSSIIPLSAKTHEGLTSLEQALINKLPNAPAFYEHDDVTDKSIRFQAAELIREQLYLSLSQELPYAVSVEIEAFEESDAVYRIAAVVWVSKDSHKGIVIGKKGAGLKLVGKQARLAMESAFRKKIHLNLWVKVKAGWNDDERALRTLGYQDF